MALSLALASSLIAILIRAISAAGQCPSASHRASHKHSPPPSQVATCPSLAASHVPRPMHALLPPYVHGAPEPTPRPGFHAGSPLPPETAHPPPGRSRHTHTVLPTLTPQPRAVPEPAAPRLPVHPGRLPATARMCARFLRSLASCVDLEQLDCLIRDVSCRVVSCRVVSCRVVSCLTVSGNGPAPAGRTSGAWTATPSSTFPACGDARRQDSRCSYYVPQTLKPDSLIPA